MKHNKKKLLTIVDEFMMLFLKLGCKGITVNFDISDTLCSIKIRGAYDSSHKSDVERLDKVLNCGRNTEMEECYWSISGAAEINHGSELYVIGSMLDECLVTFDDSYLEIVANRNL